MNHQCLQSKNGLEQVKYKIYCYTATEVPGYYSEAKILQNFNSQSDLSLLERSPMRIFAYLLQSCELIDSNEIALSRY